MLFDRGVSMGAGSAARYLPTDFVEASRLGGVCTIMVWVVIIVGFAAELRQLSNPAELRTSMELTKEDDKQVSINFDIDMLDIECRHLRVMVFDEFGSEPLADVSQNFWFQAVDIRGKAYGSIKRATEADEDDEWRALVSRNPALETGDSASEELREELSSDWLNTHDGFQHMSFKAVIQAHEFTLINFFIDSQPCADFAKDWGELTNEINGDGVDGKFMKVFSDREGTVRYVRAIRVNCKEFARMCTTQGVDAYPNVRLYKDDEKVSVYDGKLEKEKVVDWVGRQVKMRAYGWDTKAEGFERGCKAKGSLLVPRVPGHFELLVGTGDQTLNPFLTNISHRINHFSFEDPDEGPQKWFDGGGLPGDIKSQITPINSKVYLSEQPGWAWVHDIKAVGTKMRRHKNGVYQVHATSRVAKQDAQFIPQASFNYDIEPFTIVVYTQDQAWTDVSIRWLATIGGTYVTFRLFTRFALRFAVPLQQLFQPQPSSKGGLL